MMLKLEKKWNSFNLHMSKKYKYKKTTKKKNRQIQIQIQIQIQDQNQREMIFDSLLNSLVLRGLTALPY